MAVYDSAWLVNDLAQKAGMPPQGAPTPAQRYDLLTQAQNQIVADIAGRMPRVLYPVVGYSAIPTLTTSDQQLFTFGTDANGFALSPMGASIYTSLDSIPDWPWVRGRDYVPVGTTGIRIPNNNVYSGTLYWVGVSPPPIISASIQPVLFPEASRELISILAAAQYSENFARNLPVSDRFYTRYDKRWKEWCLTWRTDFRNGGVMGNWTGLGLGVGGLYQNANLI